MFLFALQFGENLEISESDWFSDGIACNSLGKIHAMEEYEESGIQHSTVDGERS